VDAFPGASPTSTGHAHLVVPAGTHLDRGGDPHHAPVGTERTVAFMTQTLALTGVDRLDDRVGELVVVDYKTSRRPNTQEEARTSLPLALYAAAVWKMFRRRCVRVELHHVPTGTVAAHTHTDESLTRKVAEAESIARDARVAEAQFRELSAESTCFPPRVSSLCTWCDLRAHCPEGQQAGPEKSGWAALEAPRSAPAVPDRLAPRRDGRP